MNTPLSIRLTLCCLMLAATQPVCAEIPGRLFFTPEQRGMLDNARRQNIQQASEEQAAMSGGVTFNGVVQRSDGRSTLWVNGRPLAGAEAASRFGAARDKASGHGTVLRLPYPGQNVGLKVGQRLDPVTGSAVEPYQDRPKTETTSDAGKEKTPDTRAPVPGAEPATLR